MIYACGFWSPSAFGGYFVQIAVLWGYAGCLLSKVERCPLLGGSKCTISIGRAIRGMEFVCCTKVICLSESPLLEVSLYIIKKTQVLKVEKEYEMEEARRRREQTERRMEEVAEAARERENELQQIIQRAEREKEEAQQLAEEAKRRNQAAERRMEEAVQTAEREKEQAQLNQRRAEEAEAEARELETQWVVRRREIQITNLELGRGGWGAVTVANFRGIQVAAKCLYKDLTSAYYRDMFNREMNMAARLRHPNLVQFIGASIEGHPIILTELMKTSLRAELENENIKQPQVKSISLNVAQALNYLHLMQPHPIIHRDISSANVLLDPLPDNQWKAKVSDYGSVNLQQQLRTENPGSPVYSAPEANTPALQSPKMDIFSFGILLVEMLTGRFPQVSSRQRLIASIDHAGYLALIQQCLSDERDQRPSAQPLLTALSEI